MAAMVMSRAAARMTARRYALAIERTRDRARAGFMAPATCRRHVADLQNRAIALGLAETLRAELARVSGSEQR